VASPSSPSFVLTLLSSLSPLASPSSPSLVLTLNPSLATLDPR
jgi:hypothetical protein